MNEWLMVSGMALVTFGLRYMLWSSDKITLPFWLTSALAYAPAAVLTAIIVPMVIYPAGESTEGAEGIKAAQFAIDNPYLVATLVAFGIALWRKNLLLTIAVGMMVFVALRWLLIV